MCDGRDSGIQTDREPTELDWFFDIYIQGSKYNFFRAESEYKAALVKAMRQRVSVIKKISNASWIRLIKLQRAHDGCLGANRR